MVQVEACQRTEGTTQVTSRFPSRRHCQKFESSCPRYYFILKVSLCQDIHANVTSSRERLWNIFHRCVDFQPGNCISYLHCLPNHLSSQSEKFHWSGWKWPLFLVAITVRRMSELGVLSIKPKLCIFQKDKMTLRTDPTFWPKVNSWFHRSQEIVLPSFCPNPSQPREKTWYILDVRRALMVPCSFLFLYQKWGIKCLNQPLVGVLRPLSVKHTNPTSFMYHTGNCRSFGEEFSNQCSLC